MHVVAEVARRYFVQDSFLFRLVTGHRCSGIKRPRDLLHAPRMSGQTLALPNPDRAIFRVHSHLPSLNNQLALHLLMPQTTNF